MHPIAVSRNLEQEVAELYAREAAGLTRYAATVAGDRDAACDAVQEAFFRYFLCRSAGQAIASPKAWLFRVVRNYLLDQRKAASRNTAGLESFRHLTSPAPTAGAADLLDGLAGIGLSPREIECLRLRIEDLRYDEIAAVMGLESGTVGALLSRAHGKIRKAVNADSRRAFAATLTGEKRYASG